MEVVYAPVIGAARVLFRALGLRLDVQGDAHVPVEGPVVLASNHVSFLDFLLVGLAARRSHRYVRFLARHDVWTNPVARPLMTAMQHVPVDREAPAAAYLRARSLLRAGEAVGIFPEAGVSTSYTVRSLMPGAVALARETGAPLVPLAIWGPQRILTAKQPVDLHRGRPVSIRVGAPLRFGPDTDLPARPDGSGQRSRTCSTSCSAGRRTSRCRGSGRPGIPPTSAATRPTRRTRRRWSRCRARRCCRPGPRAPARNRRQDQSLTHLRWSWRISASRRWARSRWWCGGSGPLSAGTEESVEIGSTSLFRRSAHRVRGQQQARRAGCAGDREEAGDRVPLGERADAGVLRALHQEAVEEVDHQAGRAERGEPALRAGDQRERAEHQGGGHEQQQRRGTSTPSQNGTPRSG